MAIIDVKNLLGFAYDDERTYQDNEYLVANAYFDENRAKELGMSPEEIAEKKKEDNCMQVIVKKLNRQ